MTKYSLVRLGIRAVVNCTPNLPNHFEGKQAVSLNNHHKEKAINPNHHEDQKAISLNHHKEKQAVSPNHHEKQAISYLRFPIGKWKAHSGEDDALLQTFLATFLQVNIFKTNTIALYRSATYHYWDLGLEKLECI